MFKWVVLFSGVVSEGKIFAFACMKAPVLLIIHDLCLRKDSAAFNSFFAFFIREVMKSA